MGDAAVLVRDRVWERVRQEADAILRREPDLDAFVRQVILDRETLEEAVASHVATRLSSAYLPAQVVEQAAADAFDDDPSLGDVLRADLAAVYDRDPVCERLIEPILYFKGFHAIFAFRVAHSLWTRGRRDLALLMQSRTSLTLQVDIHPQVTMGRGIFIDHATGVVIGATARLGDDVSLLQNVTLGGTGKDGGDRHPKIGHGVLVGAGAKILGNFTIGHCSRVASGSVVLRPVPPNVTVAGVPAKVVGEAGCPEPSRSMDQILDGLAPAD